MDWAGLPIIAHPSGVFTASWLSSSLHVRCDCCWAFIQSRPTSRMVGQFCFVGNLGERCERPGIEETSSVVGISLRALGSF